MSQQYDPTKAVSSSAAYPEVSYVDHMDDKSFKSRIKKTTIILSVLTVCELLIGYYLFVLYNGGEPTTSFFTLFLKGTVCIMTIAKAYYIVSIFMHLGDENKMFKRTIYIPLILFVWFITAFLYDGNSFKNYKNDYDPYFKSTTMPKHDMKQKAAPAAAPAKDKPTLQ